MAAATAAELTVDQHPTYAVINLGSGPNVFNPPFVRALNDALDRAEAMEGDGVRAVVLRGDGKFFSAGLDLRFLGSQSKGDVQAFLGSVFQLCARVLEHRFHTFAAVNGHCFGAGAFLALCCDYRVMRESKGKAAYFFNFPEVHLGMRLTPHFEIIAHSKLTPAALRTTVLFAKRLDAAEALTLGVVDEVAADAASAAAEAVKRLCVKPIDHDNLVIVKHELYGEAIRLLRSPPHEPKLPKLPAKM